MGEFKAIAKAGDIEVGDFAKFEIDGTDVAIANVGGTLYGLGDACTHSGCSLSAGELENTTVLCPCHGSKFDVTSGAVLAGPAIEPVSTYSVKIEGDSIQVEI